jgi:hypothetical protein
MTRASCRTAARPACRTLAAGGASPAAGLRRGSRPAGVGRARTAVRLDAVGEGQRPRGDVVRVRGVQHRLRLEQRHWRGGPAADGPGRSACRPGTRAGGEAEMRRGVRPERARRLFDADALPAAAAPPARRCDRHRPAPAGCRAGLRPSSGGTARSRSAVRRAGRPPPPAWRAGCAVLRGALRERQDLAVRLPDQQTGTTAARLLVRHADGAQQARPAVAVAG